MEDQGRDIFPLPLSPPYFHVHQDFFDFSSSAPANDFLLDQKAFSCSSSDSGQEEFPSDIFNPVIFRDNDEFELMEMENSFQQSLATKSKPPPPSYLEHLLLSDHCSYSASDYQFTDDHQWTTGVGDARYFQMENCSYLYAQEHQHLEPTKDPNLIPSYFSPPPTPHNWQTGHVSSSQGKFSFKSDEEFYFFPPNDHHNGSLSSCITNLNEMLCISTVDSKEQRELATNAVVNHMTNYPDHASGGNKDSSYLNEDRNVRDPNMHQKPSKSDQIEGKLRAILNHFGSQNVGSTHAQLWQFLLELLANPELAEGCIHWEGSEGEFRMVDPEEVARKWGKRKRRSRMNFEKMGRALRYYYDKMILKKVAGKKWTYQFNLAGILCQGKKQLQDCLDKFEKSRNLNH